MGEEGSGADLEDIEGVKVDASGVVAGFGGAGVVGAGGGGVETVGVGASGVGFRAGGVGAWEDGFGVGTADALAVLTEGAARGACFSTGFTGTAEDLNDGGGIREEAMGVEANGDGLGFATGVGSGGIGFPEGETEIFTVAGFSPSVFCGLMSMFVFNL